MNHPLMKIVQCLLTNLDLKIIVSNNLAKYLEECFRQIEMT